MSITDMHSIDIILITVTAIIMAFRVRSLTARLARLERIVRGMGIEP